MGGMDAFNNTDTKVDANINDDDFFGAASGQDDVFGTVENVKQPNVEKAKEKKEKDLVEQHDEQMNGFDAEFDDTFGDGFGFGNNNDLDIAQDNAQSDKNANAFGGDWN